MFETNAGRMSWRRNGGRGGEVSGRVRDFIPCPGKMAMGCLGRISKWSFPCSAATFDQQDWRSIIASQ